MLEKSEIEKLQERMIELEKQLTHRASEMHKLQDKYNKAKHDGETEEVLMDIHNEIISALENCDNLQAELNCTEASLWEERNEEASKQRAKQLEDEIEFYNIKINEVDQKISKLNKERAKLFQNNAPLAKRLEIEQEITEACFEKANIARNLEFVEKEFSMTQNSIKSEVLNEEFTEDSFITTLERENILNRIKDLKSHLVHYLDLEDLLKAKLMYSAVSNQEESDEESVDSLQLERDIAEDNRNQILTELYRQWTIIYTATLRTNDKVEKRIAEIREEITNLAARNRELEDLFIELRDTCDEEQYSRMHKNLRKYKFTKEVLSEELDFVIRNFLLKDEINCYKEKNEIEMISQKISHLEDEIKMLKVTHAGLSEKDADKEALIIDNKIEKKLMQIKMLDDKRTEILLKLDHAEPEIIEDDDINEILETIDELEEKLDDQYIIIEDLRKRVEDYYHLISDHSVPIDIKHEIPSEEELRKMVNKQHLMISNLQRRIMELEEELQANKE